MKEAPKKRPLKRFLFHPSSLILHPCLPPSSLILHPCFCFRPGIGLLAKELNVTKSRELNVPVVPVKLHGLYELKRRQQYFAPPGMVSVVFGDPIKFDPRLEPTAIAEELQHRLEAL